MSQGEAAEEARKIYKGLQNYLKGVKKNAVSGKPFKLGKAVRFIEALTDETSLLQAISPLAVQIVQDIDYTISHQVNVMIYSLRIGLSLNYRRTELLDLGLASLLHDIGFFLVPAALLQKAEPLTTSELEIMRDHPRLGKKLLSPWEEEYPWLLQTVYQHHERINGTGYPQGIREHEMHDYAKIIGLVDAFEATTQNRPHRKRLNQIFTSRELVSSGHAAFTPRIAKAFLREITPYPEGSYVMLNNKLLCVVVAIDRSNPLRPDVKVLYDQAGRKVPERIMKLKESPLHFIVDRLTPDELGRS